jgi:uncharacterized protein
MDWQDWTQDAFDLARERRRPVMLFVMASWCRWCRELEHSVLADERAQMLLAERFVCIRVDKDRRPDIDARYSKGGWPTLAWLDDTGELLASDTYLEVDEFLERARMVADYYERHRDTIRTRIQEVERQRRLQEEEDARRAAAAPAAQTKLSHELVDHVAHTILETSDPEYGGWGSQHKFPHPEAIDLALIRWSQTGDAAMLALVTRTLRQMQEGEIHDRVEGGFYRYATHPDWSAPNYEKMLDSNAQRLFCYLEACQALGDASFRASAEGILAWMYDTLRDPTTRAFRGSQDANPEYAHLTSIEARREFGRPACDTTVFTNWNAMTVSALLKAAVVLKNVRHRDQALATLDFLMDDLFDADVGMYHYWDGTYHLPGMLTDQAYTLRALIDAMQLAGENRYLARAEQLARLSIEHLQSPTGGFYDTLYDPHARGGLRHRNRSILENAVMAEALLRLSHLAHVKDYGDTARDTLTSFAQDYKRYGHYVAGYARAVDLLFHKPVHVTIVGPRGAETTRALSEAALGPYVASRIVQVLDPEQDVELLERAGIVVPRAGAELPRAYVHRGRESYAETSDPRRLPALMAKT